MWLASLFRKILYHTDLDSNDLSNPISAWKVNMMMMMKFVSLNEKLSKVVSVLMCVCDSFSWKYFQVQGFNI